MRLLGGVLPLQCAEDITLVERAGGWVVCLQHDMLGIEGGSKSEAQNVACTEGKRGRW